MNIKASIGSLGRDSLTYGLGSAVTRSVGLLLLPIFTKYVSTQEFGVLAMLGILGMVAQPIFSLGLSAAMGPCYFEGNDAQAKLGAVGTTFVLSLIGGGTLLLLAWGAQKQVVSLVRLPIDYANLAGLSLTACAFSIFSVPFSQQIQFEKQAVLYVWISVSSVLITMVSSVVGVVFLQLGAKGMVIGQLAGNISNFVLFYLASHRIGRPQFNRSLLPKLLSLGLPLVPSFAFLFLIMHGNRYLLEWKMGLEAVGVYSVGFSIGVGISVLTSAIASAWYPFFMGFMNRVDEAGLLFGRIITYYVFGVGAFCLFFIFAARPGVMVLTNKEFYDAIVVVGLIAVAHYVQTMFNLLLPGIYFNKEVGFSSFIQAISAALSVPVSYVFVVNFGIIGAATGVVFGNVFMVVILFVWNILNREKYPEILFEWKRLASFFVSALVLIFSYTCLPVLSLGGEILKTIFYLLFVILLLLFIINKEERNVLHNFLRKFVWS